MQTTVPRENEKRRLKYSTTKMANNKTKIELTQEECAK